MKGIRGNQPTLTNNYCTNSLAQSGRSCHNFARCYSGKQPMRQILMASGQQGCALHPDSHTWSREGKKLPGHTQEPQTSSSNNSHSGEPQAARSGSNLASFWRSGTSCADDWPVTACECTCRARPPHFLPWPFKPCGITTQLHWKSFAICLGTETAMITTLNGPVRTIQRNCHYYCHVKLTLPI